MKDKLLDAALAHVPFDGWSAGTLQAAAAECGINMDSAKTLFPRGPVDMALAYHQRGDAEMLARLKATDLSALRYRDRIAAGVRFRLEAADRDIARKGITLFSLPQNAAIGAGAVWQTCGLIWESLADTSRDVNWYTKRATLSAVYSSTLLFWLGDGSEGAAETWNFLDRRIDNVMSIEKAKGKARQTELFKAFMRGPGRVLGQIKAPASSAGDRHEGYPGHVQGENRE